jgi:hypothetical protein
MTRFVRVILNVAFVAAMAACAGPASEPTSSRLDSPAGFGGSAGAGANGPSTQAPGCASSLVAAESANGSTVCVALGGELIVMLHSGAGGGWSSPQVAGGALGPGMGIPTPNAVVGWSFRTLATGTARVSLSRPNCPVASSGMVKCHSLVAFDLRVDVR